VVLYLTKRLGLAAVVVVAIMVILAVLVHLVPGDPARIVLGPHATPELIAQVRQNMGLNDPVPVQVWDFVSNAFQGNLGTDFLSQAPVTSEIGTPLLNTAVLSLVSIVLESRLAAGVSVEHAGIAAPMDAGVRNAERGARPGRIAGPRGDRT